MVDMSRLELLLNGKGWSSAELARRLGLNTSIASDWRRGKSSPDKYITSIARILDTTEAYLRGETNDPRPSDQQGLDELDWAMLDGFRDLTDDDKREMLAILEVKKNRRKN